MANADRSTRPSIVNRTLSGVLWLWAVVAALPGFFRSRRGEEAKRAEVDYERTDIDAHGVIRVAFGILLVTWMLVGILYVVFAHFVHTPGEGGAMLPAPAEARVPLPAEPRLQPSPRRDWEQVRATAIAELNSYGWADRSKGIATIPIERAIELTAQRGIPPQPRPPAGVFYEPRAGNRLTGFESAAGGASR